ncbi:ABC transporter, substrate-binding protein [Formosa sp. Hel1_33_131]|uniref:ABC transporter substrate-binding protein n=1 Tax=Formosa sp. Hel1_33_131 TaxID=1336794 RepID=UPI00084E34A0|nr:ABC transporter substrate-binding protein [Formosa sp. Hel1_33_131]AOR29401.1 ABC transporter, substrate-binding protein [Formosa sp. Hel1_33_131]
MTKQASNYFWLRIGSVLFFSSLFLGCNTSDIDAKTKQVFRYNEHKNIGSLDPAFAKDNADISAINQLFNGLVQMDSLMDVVPAIASSWEISENAKVYTFNLREDVYFHTHSLFGTDKTRTVTANDFVYSFDRLRDPKLASPGGWVLQNVESYTALNTHRFQITLKSPFPAFLGLITMKYCSVVPKEVVEHYGADFRSNPIGTGPYKFKRWEENIKLIFRKNNRYFETNQAGEKLPYLEAVSITFLADKQSEFLQFIQGNIDYITGLDASYKDDILRADGVLKPSYASSVKMLRAPYLNTEYFGFYMDSEVSEYQSELIRQAVNYGFDRTKMMRYLRNGIGIPGMGGFIPKGLPGHNENVGYDYQPEKAKQLLETYRNESGNPQPEITLTTISNYLSFSEFIQRELQSIGLTIRIDVMPPSSLKSAKSNGKIDLFRASWVADYPDAQNYLSLFYSGNFAPNGPNYTHFKDAQFDRWYEEALLEIDQEKRLHLYQKMDALVIKKAPVVVLFYDEVIRFTSIDVRGLGINPTNLLELKNVQKN